VSLPFEAAFFPATEMEIGKHGYCRPLSAGAQGSVMLTNREPGFAETPMRTTHARLTARFVCTSCVRWSSRNDVVKRGSIATNISRKWP
jgi:hypothetical protein